jgi:hypothetical protein
MDLLAGHLALPVFKSGSSPNPNPLSLGVESHILSKSLWIVEPPDQPHVNILKTDN